MNLRDFLHIYKVKQSDFAKAIGYSTPAIQNYINHVTKCSEKLAKAVELYTQGEITAEEMMDYNRKGMEERKRKQGTKITAAMRRFLLEEFTCHLCSDCKKKLTKAYSLTKKE